MKDGNSTSKITFLGESYNKLNYSLTAGNKINMHIWKNISGSSDYNVFLVMVHIFANIKKEKKERTGRLEEMISMVCSSSKFSDFLIIHFPDKRGWGILFSLKKE